MNRWKFLSAAVLAFAGSAAPGDGRAPGGGEAVRGLRGEPEGGFREPWHTHLGFVEVLGIRQKPPHLEIRWKSAPLPEKIDGGSVTFVWTGALGSGAGRGGNFTVSVNGRPAADFDAVIEPARFLPRAPGCDLLYDSIWVYGNSLDSAGHFFLTVPAEWVRPGEPASLEVKARDIGSHRWFGLLRGDDAPLSIPDRSWTAFVRRPRPASPPPAGEEASYEWYLPQYDDPGILTTIGPPADPAEVAVSPAGQLFYSEDATHGRGGIPGTKPFYMRNALAFALCEEGTIVPLGSGAPARQELLDGFLPIVLTSWNHGDIEVKETAFAEPLVGSEYRSGLERTLAWAALEVANRGSTPRKVTFLVFHTAGEKDLRPPLAARGPTVFLGESALFSAKPPAGFSLEFAPVFPASAEDEKSQALELLRTHRAVFNAFVLRGHLGPGEKARILVNRVFDFPGTMHWGPAKGPPVAAEDLERRSFEEGLSRMRVAWGRLAGAISRFQTPDPALDRIYRKAMLDGYFLTKRWNGRLIVFDSVSYRCQWDDSSTKWFYALDLMGDHETSGRLLDTVFERQGSRKPTGTRTREGCFSDVTNTTRDGSAASWTSCNGWALWAMAEHARLSNDRRWLEGHERKVLEGCEWILRERGFSREKPENPCAGLLHGKFVCDMPDEGEVSGIGHFTYTDAVSYLGLASMARLLDEWGRPEGKRLLNEAERYRKDIVAAVDRLTDRSRDPWYVPWMLHAPRNEQRYFYDACGPINLAFGGVLRREDERIGHVIRWIIDRTHGGSLEAATAGLDAASEGAMFYSQDLAVVLLELGRVEDFLRIFYTLLASNVSHETLATCEWMGNTQPHVHSVASLIRMFRTMLLEERDGGLHLLQGTPRRWLEEGKEIRIREAPTWYGPLSLHLVSRLAAGSIRIDLEVPERIGGTPVLLRLRLPGGRRLSGASLDGKPLRVEGEWLRLEGVRGAARIEAAVEQAERR